MIYSSHSGEETFAIGMRLGESARAGDVFCLSGDLGAGKTVLAKGFGKGLGVKKEITSPTFTILNEYNGRVPFYHFDVYRITSPDDMEDTGFEDYLYGEGICLIEWAELVQTLIPAHAVWIDIQRDAEPDGDARLINLKGREI